jgi:hypothetical protein
MLHKDTHAADNESDAVSTSRVRTLSRRGAHDLSSVDAQQPDSIGGRKEW